MSLFRRLNPLIRSCNVRFASRLVHHEYGIPADVVRMEFLPELDYPLHADYVVVKMQMAPINPADVNMIEGQR